MRDARIVRDNEYSDSEDEGDNRRDHRSYRRSGETKKDLIDEKSKPIDSMNTSKSPLLSASTLNTTAPVATLGDTAAMTIVQDASGRAVVRNLSVKPEEPMEEEKNTQIPATTKEQEQRAIVDEEKDVVMTAAEEVEPIEVVQTEITPNEPTTIATESTAPITEEVKEEIINNETEEGELEEKPIDEMQIDQEETTNITTNATDAPLVKTETMEPSS
jgi:hypothetical protein